MNKGIFVFSLDTELAWGASHDEKKIRKNTRYYMDYRKNIYNLLRLMEKYNISATWAVVGHLFLSGCRPNNGIKHPDVIRPNFKWASQNWFDLDPCSSVGEDPFWYGSDIVEAIMKCKVHQEIGCHTFSHVIVGDPGCTQACFDSELKECHRLAGNLGIDLKSFVFPRNKANYISVLADNGFIAYRGKDHSWYGKLPKALQYLAGGIDSYLMFIPSTFSPEKEPDNCWNISGSYYFGGCAGPRKFIPIFSRVKKVQRGLNKAIEKQQVFHLWIHPLDLATDAKRVMTGIEKIFISVNKLRESGALENLSMGALALKLEKRQYHEAKVNS